MVKESKYVEKVCDSYASIKMFKIHLARIRLSENLTSALDDHSTESSGIKNLAVSLRATFVIFSGVPTATISPP